MRKFNVVIGTTTTLVMTYMIWLAFLSGEWKITMHFNEFGEGLPELVLLTFGSLNSLYWLHVERNNGVTADYREKIEERMHRLNP
jgi:hypothetical protein